MKTPNTKMGNCCHAFPFSTNTTPAVGVEDVDRRDVRHFTGNPYTTDRLAVALYSLDSQQTTILNFVEGDILVIEDDRDPDWYLARHVSDDRKAFVPKNYLSVDMNAGNEDWFFEHANREEAERLLHQPENPPGTFMVRKSHLPGIYALSVKDHEVKSNGNFIIRHYQIRTLDNGGYFISTSISFSTLKQLVYYYTSSDGLCCRLKGACSRPRPTMPGPSPDIRNDYEIPHEDLNFVKLLGKGNFGEVFYGYWKGTLEVAIKCVKSNGLQSDDFKREVAVMKTINHPKIVRLYAVCTTKEPYCIVMEYMNKGNLQQHLRSLHGKQLKLPSLVNITAQIADGMKYLESNNLIHRDLAARNILVNDGNIVKLADFGLARIMDDAVYVSSGGKLPIKWTAPESYASGEFNIKSDVWSFGIVMYEIFTHGNAPYQGMTNQQVSKAVSRGYRMPKPSDPVCSNAVYEIMLQCWRAVPSERPTFDYLCHFFTDYYVTSERAYGEGVTFT